MSPAHTDPETCQWHFQDQPNKIWAGAATWCVLGEGCGWLPGWEMPASSSSIVKVIYSLSSPHSDHQKRTSPCPSEWPIASGVQTLKQDSFSILNPKSMWPIDVLNLMAPHHPSCTVSHKKWGPCHIPLQASFPCCGPQWREQSHLWVTAVSIRSCPWQCSQTFVPAPLLFLSPPAGYCEQGKGKLGGISFAKACGKQQQTATPTATASQAALGIPQPCAPDLGQSHGWALTSLIIN